MTRYFLDTSVIVDFFNGKGETGKILENGESEVTSSWVCMGELWEGIQNKKNKNKWEKDIRNFFGNLDEVFGMDIKVAEKFGEIRDNLRKRGDMIEDLDILIAAICVVNDLVLVTGNKKHFGRVRGFQIY
jgi:tRNA(fMet)-specific endonuclease VapC